MCRARKRRLRTCWRNFYLPGRVTWLHTLTRTRSKTRRTILNFPLASEFGYIPSFIGHNTTLSKPIIFHFIQFGLHIYNFSGLWVFVRVRALGLDILISPYGNGLWPHSHSKFIRTWGQIYITHSFVQVCRILFWQVIIRPKRQVSHL